VPASGVICYAKPPRVNVDLREEQESWRIECETGYYYLHRIGLGGSERTVGLLSVHAAVCEIDPADMGYGAAIVFGLDVPRLDVPRPWDPGPPVAGWDVPIETWADPCWMCGSTEHQGDFGAGLVQCRACQVAWKPPR
jgi:hypothetical protein